MRIDVDAHSYPSRYIDCVSRLRGERNYRIRAPGIMLLVNGCSLTIAFRRSAGRISGASL